LITNYNYELILKLKTYCVDQSKSSSVEIMISNCKQSVNLMVWRC